jgi:hypothetical protein
MGLRIPQRVEVDHLVERQPHRRAGLFTPTHAERGTEDDEDDRSTRPVGTGDPTTRDRFGLGTRTLDLLIGTAW